MAEEFFLYLLIREGKSLTSSRRGIKTFMPNKNEREKCKKKSNDNYGPK